MKRIIFLLLLAATACNKKNDPMPSNILECSNNEYYFNMAGWNSNCNTIYGGINYQNYKDSDLSIFAFDTLGATKQLIRFDIDSVKVGVNIFKDNTIGMYGTTGNGKDVFTNLWHTQTGSITVDYFDNSYISGSFNFIGVNPIDNTSKTLAGSFKVKTKYMN